MEKHQLVLDPITLRTFRQAYEKAREQNLEQFTVTINGESYELVTDYAKYVIEYATRQFANTHTN